MVWREWLVGLLLLIAGVTHLAGLGRPREVIFDEVHFGKFVTAYCCTGERFFDIHPPHAKLIIAAAARLGGYQGNFSFDHIGQPYGEVSPISFRIVPAMAGVALPIIIYILLRQLGASLLAAFFGGLAVALDNAILIQTRVMALDGILLVATFGSLSAYLAAERSWLAGQGAGRYLLWAGLAGALAGLAVGTKFTGLIALGLIGVLGGYQLYMSRGRQVSRLLAAAGVILTSAAAVYALGWVLHVVLLTQPGGGDAWGVERWDLIGLHQTMYRANNGLTTAHHDSSPWWGWPFMQTPVFYWQKSGLGSPLVGALYFIGNPVVWVGSTLLALAAAAWIGLTAARQGKLPALGRVRLSLPLLGYVMSYGPLTRVDRGLFLYHYLTPLLFAIILGVLWLDRLGWFGSGGGPIPRRVWIGVGAVIIGFLIFSPLTYGWLLHPDTQALLFWSRSWR